MSDEKLSEAKLLSDEEWNEILENAQPYHRGLSTNQGRQLINHINALNAQLERERDAARSEALEDAAKMVEGLKYLYPVLKYPSIQGMLGHIAKRIRNLTATPASTGGTPR